MSPSVADQIARDPARLVHPTLSAYYLRLATLRAYLVAKGYLTDRSTIAIALKKEDGNISACPADLLDSAVVGCNDSSWKVSGTAMDSMMWDPASHLTQQEAVDKAQAEIFARLGSHTKQIAKMNVLTTGYQRTGQDHAPNISRNGLDANHVNSQITTIRSDPAWRAVHTAIGTDAFVHLLVTSCIFMPLQNNCFYQLCGLPLCYTKTMAARAEEALKLKQKRKIPDEGGLSGKRKKRRLAVELDLNPPVRKQVEKKKPVDVKIIRNRMFYGKWGYRSGTRRPCCGLPESHILNRLEPPPPRRSMPNTDSEMQNVVNNRCDAKQEARTLLRYIFPREHGLRNAFEVKDEDRDWTGKAPFYTNFGDRRDEIMFASVRKQAKTSKRLKGSAVDMMDQIIANHRKCDYWQLRAICCPSKMRRHPLSKDGPILHQKYIAHGESVYRYAHMACKEVFPSGFWGCEHNEAILFSNVRSFVLKRRFESVSVHQILQGFRPQDCEWLAGPQHGQRRVASDAGQCRRMMEEVVYWFFDSFLVGLLKVRYRLQSRFLVSMVAQEREYLPMQNTFYITETGATKYATTYYRLDDWDSLCRPLYRQLTTVNLSQLSQGRQNVLRRDVPRHSILRLLPKVEGLRPISNLGKKLRCELANGTVIFKQSVNELLSEPFLALTCEKSRHPDLLDSSLFGMYDIYNKLKAYKTNIISRYGHLPNLYFVKVDVKKAFDSIDQAKLLQVLDEVLQRSGDYVTTRYSQILPPTGRAPVLWAKKAWPNGEVMPFGRSSNRYAANLHNAIFVDQVDQTKQDRGNVLRILREHIQGNLVKVGRDYYGQKVGIPQGSRVSSLLCSFFYGHMQRENLAFASDPEALLVRIIDDFLYVSTSREQCNRFLGRMLRGQPDYGCFVAVEKSLSNFATSSGIPQLDRSHLFPFCGMLIDTRSLDIHIDVRRSYGLHVREALTVKTTTRQGKNFAGWLKRMLENYNHVIYHDTSMSSRITVVANIYTNFLLAAMKTVHYLRGIAFDEATRGKSTYLAIDDAIRHTCNASRGHLKTRAGRSCKAELSISKREFIWIAKHAFCKVFSSRSHGFTGLIAAFADDVADKNAYGGTTSGMERVLGDVWESVQSIPF